MYCVTLIMEARDEDGELVDSDVIVDTEMMDDEDVIQAGRKYGIDGASSSAFPATGNESFWFCSTQPDEDSDHFERGVSKFYSFHLVSVNGAVPVKSDFEDVADLLGVRL